jgi:hypothetical protein
MILLGANQLGEGYKVDPLLLSLSSLSLLVSSAVFTKSVEPQLIRLLNGIPTWHIQFITLLENILPIEFQEEWLGDLREQRHQSIKEGKPPWKVGFITLFTGLGLILSYFWLESDKLVSRWMTRAKKVFLG